MRYATYELVLYIIKGTYALISECEGKLFQEVPTVDNKRHHDERIQGAVSFENFKDKSPSG